MSKSLQEELKDRGYIALCSSTSNVDVDIFRLIDGKNVNVPELYFPLVHISYSDIVGKNGSEVLEFVLSKLPKNETK